MPLSYIETMKLYKDTTFVVVPYGQSKAVVPHTAAHGIRFDTPIFAQQSVHADFFNLLSASTFMFETLAASVGVVEAMLESPELPPSMRATLRQFSNNLSTAIACAVTGPEATAAAHMEQMNRKPRQ